MVFEWNAEFGIRFSTRPHIVWQQRSGQLRFYGPTAPASLPSSTGDVQSRLTQVLRHVCLYHSRYLHVWQHGSVPPGRSRTRPSKLRLCHGEELPGARAVVAAVSGRSLQPDQHTLLSGSRNCPWQRDLWRYLRITGRTPGSVLGEAGLVALLVPLRQKIAKAAKSAKDLISLQIQNQRSDYFVFLASDGSNKCKLDQILNFVATSGPRPATVETYRRLLHC